jgi:deoxyribonuclease IV
VTIRTPVPLLGAHVSTQGGVAAAPDRGRAIGATAIQIFTKTPNQWRDPVITLETADLFRSRLERSGIQAVVAHDSYLINLASPDSVLWEKSVASFTRELERCRALGIAWVVSHPGNFIDQREAGIARNARGYAACLACVDGPGVLIEGTAGAGTALGATFEELAALRAALSPEFQRRVGFCLDTAHLHAAGYNVAGDLEGVWREFDACIGLDQLRCLHLNDSRAKAGSHLDRHAWIGEGTIGPEAFRRIMRASAMEKTIKIIETPKGDDGMRHDRRMLRRLRAYARGPRPASVAER